MKLHEKLAVYPYDLEFTPVLRHSDMLKDYDIVKLISPKGWGLSGLDCGTLDGGAELGMIIEEDFDEAIKMCQSVLFLYSFNEKYSHDKEFIRNMVTEKIYKAIEAGKNIVCDVKLGMDTINTIKELCSVKGVRFNNISAIGDPDNSNLIKIPGEHRVSIETPVVFVMGLSDQTNKFEIQLALREALIQKGYKVSQIGTRNICELLGFHAFPHFMFGNSYEESEKIVLFSHYVKNLEMTEKPDVIIIGVPGGIMPFNNIVTNKFGITAFEVSNAVLPDYVIFSILYEEFDEKYFQMLDETMSYKFGFEIDCFNLSNVKFDWAASEMDKDVSFITLNSGFIDKEIKNFSGVKKPVINAMSKEGIEIMINHLLKELNSEV
jgi:peptide maturation system protein (TIGR04066 family)